MNKEKLLAFNVGPVYLDFLQSFKKHLAVSLTKDKRIDPSELIFTDTFNNISLENSQLDLKPNHTDDLIVTLKNRNSEIEFSIDKLDVSKINVYLKSVFSEDIDARSVSTVDEIINNGNITEIFIEWLEKKELPAGSEDFFDKASLQ